MEDRIAVGAVLPDLCPLLAVVPWIKYLSVPSYNFLISKRKRVL